MDRKLYIDTNKEHWILKDENDILKCDITEKELNHGDLCFVVSYLDNQLGNKTVYLSLEGLRKLKKSYAHVIISTQALITKFKMRDFKLVIPESLELQPAKFSGYGAFTSVEEFPSEESDDYSRAPLSIRGLSFEGANIGKVDYDLLLSKEKVVNLKEFDLIINSMPVDVGLLDDKSEE